MRRVLIACSCLALAFTAAAAADEPKRAWTDSTEFSLLSTGGNSKSLTFGFANHFKYGWTRSELLIDATAARVETTKFTRTNPDGTVVTTEASDVTTDAYNLGGKYRFDVTPRFFVLANAGWTRSRPAGIENREWGGLGAGWRIVKTEAHKLNAELGVDYTAEKQVSDISHTYASGRVFLGYEWAINAGTKFIAELEGFDDLSDTPHWRGRGLVSIASAMTRHLALKVAYTALYDRQPAEVLVKGDTPEVPDAFVPLKTTDTTLAASLVVTW